MVKSRAKTVQKKLQKLKQAQARNGSTRTEVEGPAPPKRVKEKLTKKVKFLQKVADSKPRKLGVTKAGLGKHGSGKRRRQGRPSTLTDLSTLMEGLQAASHEAEAGAAEQLRRKGQSVTSQRGRARVLEQEAGRLQQVLHHPQFIADPLAAVRTHLSATLPEAPPASARGSRAGAGSQEAKLPRSEKKKRQKANRAARAAAAAMEEGD